MVRTRPTPSRAAAVQASCAYPQPQTRPPVTCSYHESLCRAEEAKAAGCRFRTGPELEITGYGCEDSFLENDTFAHSWESLARLLSSDLTVGILVDVGMPILHKGVAYNCRVILLDRCVIGIRPKLFLANDGNYREMRWFTPWHVATHAAGPHYAFGALQEFQLPAVVLDAVDSTRQPSGGTVPIGIFAVQAFDAAVGFETCEELFTPSELPLGIAPLHFGFD